MALSPDGQHLAVVDGTQVQLWDLSGNRIGSPLVGHQGAIYTVIFSPDGQYIATASDDKTVRLWDRSGKLLGRPFKGNEPAIHISFSPDSQNIAIGDANGTAYIRTLKGRSLGSPIRGHSGSVKVQFSSDGQQVATNSSDGTTMVLPINWPGWIEFMCHRFSGQPSLTAPNPKIPVERESADACRNFG